MDKVIGKKRDIGLIWAHMLAVWGQVSVPYSIIMAIMMAGTFYSTTIKGVLPFWVYIAILAVMIVSVILFVVFVGISGYYRFLNQRSALDQINSRLEKIMNKLDIEDEY